MGYIKTTFGGLICGIAYFSNLRRHALLNSLVHANTMGATIKFICLIFLVVVPASDLY
jgi:hypothetical protein